MRASAPTVLPRGTCGASRAPPPMGCLPWDTHQISRVPRESKRRVYDVFPSWRKAGGNGIQEYAIYAAFSVQPHGKNKRQGVIAPCLLLFGIPCRWVQGVRRPPPTGGETRADEGIRPYGRGTCRWARGVRRPPPTGGETSAQSPFTRRTAMRSSGSSMPLSWRALEQFSIRLK